MAEELEKTAGDSVNLLIGGEARDFTVCGVYQDVTSGGRTAKTVCAFPQEPAEKYEFAITLSSTANADSLTTDLREQLGNGYSIENMEEFLRQTLGGVTAQVQQASYAVLLIGVCLTVLITALFLKLRVAREIAALAAKKAMGIPFTAICLQELYPVLFAGGFGSVCGVLLAEFLGDNLISGLSGMLGIGLKKIIFAQAPVWQFLVIPAVLLVTLSVVTMSICAEIKGMDTASHINE